MTFLLTLIEEGSHLTKELRLFVLSSGAFNLPFVIHFFNVTGVTIFLALQISVKYMMFKMSKTSYNPLQTVG